MLGRCIHFVYHFFDEIWVACQLCKFINRHPAKDNIAVVLVGHKFADAWNVGASNQFNQMLGSLLFIYCLTFQSGVHSYHDDFQMLTAFCGQGSRRLNVVRQTVSKWEKGLSVPDSELLIKLAEILEVPVSRLLGSKIEAEEQPDALAEQLSRINEQLAIKNRRAKRVWKAIAFIVGDIIAVYVLILILATVFTFSPNRSGTTDSSQSIVSIVEKE